MVLFGEVLLAAFKLHFAKFSKNIPFHANLQYNMNNIMNTAKMAPFTFIPHIQRKRPAKSIKFLEIFDN